MLTYASRYWSSLLLLLQLVFLQKLLQIPQVLSQVPLEPLYVLMLKEDVDDVQEIMACGKWNLESMITHEFPLEQLDQALYKASDVNNSLNVIIKMKK